ncbi:MAG: hypothetical protein WC441_04080 [Patescibacteria group bacterium]
MKNKKIIGFIIVACFFLGGISRTGSAAPLIPTNESGNYTLNDFVILGVNISNLILGLVGSLSLLMFIYGGITFLISAGNAEQVSKAQKIIIAAVVGLIIVFTSYLIIQFIMTNLGYKFNGGVWNAVSNK